MSKPMTVKEYEAHIPSSYRGNYRKAMSGKSRAAALKAKCLDCMNWQRTEVTACAAETCPLYPYRPFQNGDEPENSANSEDLTEEQEKSDRLPETGA
jgi:hypothetical protein